jgi:hypothetical protein
MDRQAESLLKLLREIKRYIDTISKKNSSTDSPSQPPPEIIIHPVVSLPPAVHAYYEAEQRERPRKNRRERIKRGVEYGGIALLAVYTYFTIGIYTATKDAAKAATSAADTASQTLSKSIESFRIDERAWIEIDRIERTQVSVKGGNFGAAFRYRLYPRNVGKTEAHGIVVNAARNMQTSISLESDADGMERTQGAILLNALPREVRENPIPKVIAPNTSTVFPFVMDGQEPQIFVKDEWVSYLIGRIDYMDVFGMRHWMKFCFYVADSNGNLWNCHEGNDATTERNAMARGMSNILSP